MESGAYEGRIPKKLMEVFMGKGKKWFALLLVVALLITSYGRSPVEAQAAAKQKTVTVSTQKQLEAALGNAQVGKIIISTKGNLTLVIPKSSKSTNKSLVVNATKATIVNNASFKAITIQASKKFTENGKNNAIVHNNKKAVIAVSSKAQVKSLVSNGADSRLTIEKGAVVDKLSSNAVGATILVGQSVTIKNVALKGSNGSMTLAKGAVIKEAAILGLSADVKVENGAALEKIALKKKGAALHVVADGKVAIDILEKAFLSVNGKAKSTIVNIDKKAAGTSLEASTAIQLDTKAMVDITLKAGAEGSTLKASEQDTGVAVKNDTAQAVTLVTKNGAIKIGKGEELKKEDSTVKPTMVPTAVPTSTPSNGGGNSNPPMDPTPTGVPVDKNGFDNKGRMVANFGTPSIDGIIDSVWEKAVQVSAVESNKTPVKAKFRMLWDDKAIYLLAEVKDDVLDGTSGNVYDRDSVEIFFDENNDKTVNYNKDDLHFRVSYDNKQSADNGDLGRFYTKTSLVKDGYIVEARIALTTKPANNTVFGIDLSVNDGKAGRKVGQIGVYDQNNEAYKDTSKFGAIVLTGRSSGAVSGLNPYDLMSTIEEGKEIKLERYKNGAAVLKLIEEAEAALRSRETTQKVINTLHNNLRGAIDGLISDGKSYDEKECRRIPKEYLTVDQHPGTIERITYNTKSYDSKNEARVKDFLVYLPNGYDQKDKTKKYNVLYLIHGMGENQNTVFGGPGQNTEMMKILDNMIYNKQIEPLIIVTPTWSYKGNSGDFSVIFTQTENFHNELVKDIIPTVEAKYNTYAASTSERDLIAAREHRALGGFSMGSSTTWNTFISRIDYFKYYMPMSLACLKNDGLEGYEGSADEKRAEYLADVIRKAGYGPNDVSIFCATGTEDMAYGGMVSQINAMKKVSDIFLYTADLNRGNFYFMTLEGGTHTWNCVNRYLYNMLPDLFNNKSIDPAIIQGRNLVIFNKNDGTGIATTRRAYNGAVKLPTTEVKMPGAELVGWSNAADSEKVVTLEADGTYKVTGDTTLYAVWKWSTPSVASEVTLGEVPINASAPQSVKLGVAVFGSNISVSGSAIGVPNNAIIAGAGAGFTLNITKSVSANVTGKYIIQYAAVDMQDLNVSDVIWKNVVVADNNEVVHVDAASVDRKILVRVISGEGCKFLKSNIVTLVIRK